MLKLLKYELLYSYRQYVLTFAIFLAACLFIPMLPYYLQDIFSGLIMVLVTIIGVALFVNVVSYFNSSMFQKAGYLTLTLPVSTKQLILSKIIAAMIWLVISGVILCFGIIISLFTVLPLTFADLGYLFFDFISMIYQNFSYLILEVVFPLVMWVMVVVLSLYFTITCVHTKYIRKHRTIIGIMGYLAALILLMIFTSSSLYVNLVSTFTPTGLSWFTLFMYALCSVGLFYGTVYMIDHALEIE